MLKIDVLFNIHGKNYEQQRESTLFLWAHVKTFFIILIS